MQHKDSNLWVGSLWGYDSNNRLLVILEWSIRSSSLRTLCRMCYLNMQMHAPRVNKQRCICCGSWWLCASPVYPWSRKSGCHGEPVSKGARTNGKERGHCLCLCSACDGQCQSGRFLNGYQYTAQENGGSAERTCWLPWAHYHSDEKKHIRNWCSYKLYLYRVC